MPLFDFLLKSFKSHPLSKLEKICGYQFRNRTYLEQAFTHRSISSLPRQNYERLEFLGDAVIDIVVSRELMREFPEGDEGLLTQKHIEATVDLNQEKIAVKQSANLYEALIGAMYLDRGIEPAKKLILDTIWTHRNEAWKSVNHKGQLIELCHEKQMANPKFLVSNVTGPDHQKLFEVHVKIGDEIYPSGIGTNKKAAEQHAAQFAMDALQG